MSHRGTGAPEQFFSCFSLWLGLAWPDDVIKEHCPAGIKASSEKSARGTQQAGGYGTVPQTEQRPPDAYKERPEKDPAEGSRA